VPAITNSSEDEGTFVFGRGRDETFLLPPHEVGIIQRMRISSLLPVVAVVFVSAGLLGQDTAPTNRADKECQNATTSSAMRACENRRYADAQRELDAAYQDLLRRLDEAQRQKLRVAQRAWLRFRDTNAEFQASLAQGGTLGPLLKTGSLAEMTQARALELKKAVLP
jgi:uncharacterized protein YecT (DUF1311 family)